MKIYKTQSEVEKDIKDGVLVINDDVTFERDIAIDASIIALNIDARDINAWDIDASDIKAEDINAEDIDAGDINAEDIKAWDIDASDIKAEDINAEDIKARDINAEDIKAWDIDARDINARDINAGDIDARDISYYAFCCAYGSIKCSSFKARREVHQEPICLDGKLTIKKKPDLSGKEVEVKINGVTYKAVVK